VDVSTRGIATPGEGEPAPDVDGESTRCWGGPDVHSQRGRTKSRLIDDVEHDVPRIVEARDREQLRRIGAEGEATILHALEQEWKLDRIQRLGIARGK